MERGNSALESRPEGSRMAKNDRKWDALKNEIRKIYLEEN
jgi:hypothetical protein